MDEIRVEEVTLPRTQRYTDSVFPSALELRTPASISRVVEWVADQRERLLGMTRQHGAVLLRGFPVQVASDFDALINSLCVENFPYKQSLSNAVRVNYTERVFSANEAPPTVRIYLHHELAQTPMFPEFIFFFCEIAPEKGGETPICRSDVLYERLAQSEPQFVQDLEAYGLQYTNVMPSADDLNSGMGRSWQSTLGVASREQAERRLEDLGYSWQWLDDGALRASTPPLPAVREVSPGRKTLFNQLIAAYSGWSDDRNDPSKAIRLGNGQPLDPRAVQCMIDLADALTFDVRWQPTDVVLMDNTLAMHGRRPFEGSRRVLASLANMRTHGPVRVPA